MSVKVAFVGAGYTITEHVKAFASLKDAQLVGIHSRTRAKAEKIAAERNIPFVAGSVDELWEKTKADLVVVGVPELSANAVMTECLRHPWTILCEKPVGLDPKDCLDIAKKADAAKRKVYAAHNRAHYAATRAVLSDLSSSSDRRFIKVQDQQSMTRALAAGQPKKVVENWMYANSIHLVDYFRLFARGKPVTVEPSFPWNPTNPGPMSVAITFDSGDSGLYEAVWEAPGPWAAIVTAGTRRWELRPLETLTRQELGKPAVVSEPDRADLDFKPGFLRQAEEALKAARGELSSSTTLAQSLATMRLIARIYDCG